MLVSRYRTSPAIFAWELANEPRSTGCDTSVVTDWARSTSAYIKRLDSDHLVTLGDEGWFALAAAGAVVTRDDDDGSSGVDFVGNLGQIATLDYGTFHLYPDAWGYECA